MSERQLCQRGKTVCNLYSVLTSYYNAFIWRLQNQKISVGFHFLIASNWITEVFHTYFNADY